MMNALRGWRWTHLVLDFFCQMGNRPRQRHFISTTVRRPHVFAHITAHTPHDEPRRDHPMFIPGVDVGMHAPRALPRAPPLGPRAFLAGPKREVQIRNRPAQGEGAAARRRPARAASGRRGRRGRVAVARRPRAVRRPRARIRRGRGHHPEGPQGQLLPRRARAHPRGQATIRALVRRRRHDLRRGARRIDQHRSRRV